MIDSIEKLFQIKINHPAVACSNILLRLSHGLMCRSSRSKPVAALGERRVPPPLQNLHYRLLDKAVQHGGDAKLSHPSSIRLRDFHPPHRFRFVGPVQQLLPNSRPVLLQVRAQLTNGHPVDARTTFVAPPLPQRFLQVCSLTYFLRNTTRVGWAFGLIHHRGDSMSSLPACRASPVGADGKSSLIWNFSRLSLSRFMSYLPLLSFGPSATVPGSAYLLTPPFGDGVPH